MGWRWRRRLALLALILGLPAYIFVAVTIVSMFERPGVLTELLVYVVLGFVWALPLRRLFLGIGRPDPEARDDGDER